MKIFCPNCQTRIPTQQINVAMDVAICHDCNEGFTISHLLGTKGGTSIGDPRPQAAVDLDNPPRGVTFDRWGMGWRLSSTTRSVAGLFLVPFMLIWSGGSLGGIYGMQIVTGKFNLWLSLFGIPFVLGTVFFGSFALMSVVGRIVFTADEMDPDRGRMFLGIGPVGLTRRFLWSEVEEIDESVRYGSRGGPYYLITLRTADNTFEGGSLVSDRRRKFLIDALRQIILQQR